MADTFVAITAGSGTNIDTFTEATNGHHRQCVVIGDPSITAGVAAVDATYGLEVDVSRIVPGTGATNLAKAEDAPHTDGDVGVLFLGVRNHNSGSTTDGDYSAVSVDSTGNMNTVGRKDMVRFAGTVGGTSTTTAYAAGDTVGTLNSITSAARVTGGYGSIKSVQVINTTASTATPALGAMDVIFFRSSVTLPADNAAFVLSGATDPLAIVGVAQLAGAFAYGAAATNSRSAQAYNLDLPFDCSGGTTLYAALITRSAMTLASTGTATLTLVVHYERY